MRYVERVINHKAANQRAWVSAKAKVSPKEQPVSLPPKLIVERLYPIPPAENNRVAYLAWLAKPYVRISIVVGTLCVFGLVQQHLGQVAIVVIIDFDRQHVSPLGRHKTTVGCVILIDWV